MIRRKKKIAKIRRSENHIETGGVRELIFGAQDGIVTTLGVVLGVSAAGTTSPLIVIVAGLAAMLAEAISMGVGSYISEKSEQELISEQIAIEKKEMNEIPDIERKEVYWIYHKKGFRGKLLKDIVKKITSDRKLWLEEMLVWELGMPPGDHRKRQPLETGLLFFFASLLGIIPILPFLFMEVAAAIPYAIAGGFATLFIVGAAKTSLTKKNWLSSGGEMMILGVLSAAAGYGVGVLLGAPVV